MKTFLNPLSPLISLSPHIKHVKFYSVHAKLGFKDTLKIHVDFLKILYELDKSKNLRPPQPHFIRVTWTVILILKNNKSCYIKYVTVGPK